ncbi:MAG: hypothetical protein ACT4QD_21330 [Acidobacteriota bacterium]
MISFQALGAGIRAILRAPWVLVVCALSTLLVAAPLTYAMATALEESMQGSTLSHLGARVFPAGDWDGLATGSPGVLATLTPAILGLAGPLGTISNLLDGVMPPAVISASILVYALLWVFLWGGTLDVMARGWISHEVFIAASRQSAGRLLRLTAGALAVYGVVAFTARATDGLSTAPASDVEWLLRLLPYVAVAAVLLLVSLVVDYTRIYLVVAGCPRVADALRAALRLIGRHTGPVLVLAALGASAAGAALAGFAAFELFTRGTPSAWAAILIGHLYVALRLTVRLAVAAAQVALLQRLAPRV